MTDEVETLETAASSSQAAPDANPGSSAPENPTDAKGATPSTAQGDKKPGSISEALSQVKLEEPAENEAGAGVSPSTEKAESEKAAAEGTDKTGEQSGKAGKADDSANDPFHKRPEWGELNKALGDEGAKKARPIIRNLMERERRAVEQVSQMRPVLDELRSYAGDDKGFQTMRSVVRAYATDPGAAVPILEQMLTDAKTRAGHVVSSPDLKARLDGIQKKVDDGLMDEETAQLARESILEAEKGRAGAKSATAKVQQSQQQREQEAREAANGERLNALNAWEENIRGRDPEFGNVTPADDPRHGESVADRVFDALQLKFMSDPNITTDKLIAEAKRVYGLARSQIATPPARPSRPLTANGSSITAKPKARTMREAMDSVRLE